MANVRTEAEYKLDQKRTLSSTEWQGVIETVRVTH